MTNYWMTIIKRKINIIEFIHNIIISAGFSYFICAMGLGEQPLFSPILKFNKLTFWQTSHVPKICFKRHDSFLQNSYQFIPIEISGQSRLHSSHLDKLCFVASILPRGGSNDMLSKYFLLSECSSSWN